jgi:hypothetical protein
MKWMFALNTPYSQMLKEALFSFIKATKIMNLTMNIMASHYALPEINCKYLFEEMTKFLTSHLKIYT